MYNLIRMDIRRMLRSRSLYICLAVVICSAALTFGMMYGVGNPKAQETLESMGITLAITNPEVLETMNQISVMELLNQGGVRGGAFACVTGILAAIFLCGEYESGFVKNIFAVCENKWKYILSKLGCLCLVNLFFLLGMFLVVLLLNMITGSFFQWVSLEDALIYLVSAWMLQNAFSALYMLVSIVTRSKAAGVAAGIFLGTGTVVTLLSTGLGLVGWNKFLDYSIYATINQCPLAYEKPGDFKPMLIGIIFIVCYTVISKVVVQKKDI